MKFTNVIEINKLTYYSEDLRMCFDSALKGLEIWKVYPLQNKLFLISKLIRSLQYSRLGY